MCKFLKVYLRGIWVGLMFSFLHLTFSSAQTIDLSNDVLSQAPYIARVKTVTKSFQGTVSWDCYAHLENVTATDAAALMKNNIDIGSLIVSGQQYVQGQYVAPSRSGGSYYYPDQWSCSELTHFPNSKRITEFVQAGDTILRLGELPFVEITIVIKPNGTPKQVYLLQDFDRDIEGFHYKNVRFSAHPGELVGNCDAQDFCQIKTNLQVGNEIRGMQMGQNFQMPYGPISSIEVAFAAKAVAGKRRTMDGAPRIGLLISFRE